MQRFSGLQRVVLQLGFMPSDLGGVTANPGGGAAVVTCCLRPSRRAIGLLLNSHAHAQLHAMKHGDSFDAWLRDLLC